jgi:cytochrome c oxidase cbb3-type subunit I/II
VNCHSQTIRPFRSETSRYGEYSKAGEFIYDRPFLWGSKRTGPDLHRIGGKYPNKWHFDHLLDPTITSPGSIMPAYPWLIDQKLDQSLLQEKMRVMRDLGVPYSDDEIANAIKDADNQAESIVKDLKANQVEVKSDREIVAVIAYLQRLGTDIKAQKTK